MPFTFTVEDGTGLDTANSYVSVAEADDYFAVDPNAAEYLALENADKEKYLAWASRVLDQKTEWRGDRAVSDSGLRWPRKFVYDKDRILLSSVIVPKQVKEATCEMARFLINYNPAEGQGGDNLKRIAVDVVEIEYQDDASQNDWPALINAILYPIGTFRTGGAGFGKILKV